MDDGSKYLYEEVLLWTFLSVKGLQRYMVLPIVPMFLFAGMIMGCVALAYYLGGRKLYRNNMIETLKNDMLT
jgi:putative ABC transport system permease protein